MEAIKLTEDHRSKLLEMCKELFPEMDAYLVQDTEESNGLILGTWGQSTDGIAIHWFEFCMIHLAKKVCKSDGITLTFKDNNNNVIEFLYEQFKKLK